MEADPKHIGRIVIDCLIRWRKQGGKDRDEGLVEEEEGVVKGMMDLLGLCWKAPPSLISPALL